MMGFSYPVYIGNVDYEVLNSLPLTLAAGSTSNCVTVGITDNSVIEERQKFFNLELSSNDPDVIIGTPLTPVATLNDDSK